MRTWRHLLGGLLLWTAHFFAVYGIASVLPGTREASVLVVVVTVAALAVAAVLFIRAFQKSRRAGDKLVRWMHSAAALGYALAGAAVVYQGLPALLS